MAEGFAVHRCLFCGGDASAPDHLMFCDGRQGGAEAFDPRVAFAPVGFTVPGEGPDHDGETYDPDRDHVRLNAQTLRVWEVMKGGAWMTLKQISDATGDPEASISARLRDLRKAKFGGHTVERDCLGGGLHMYRVIP